MMMQDVTRWQRLDAHGTPVYLQPETPNWLIPNAAGDALFQHVQQNGCLPDGADPGWLAACRQLLWQMESPHAPVYAGRASLLGLDRLEECWFHITDRCNLACHHCLFACSAESRTTLSIEDFSTTFHQSFDLGARIFYLTGGEPLIHPDIAAICQLVLNHSEQNHLVILTNGLLLKERWSIFPNLPTERLHLQISVDGDRQQHDSLRGDGCYDRLVKALALAGEAGVDTNLAMAVHRDNLGGLKHPVALAREHGLKRVHYLWLLLAGKARPDHFVEPEPLFTALMDAHAKAQAADIEIDNITSLAGRVFSPPGTRHDLGGGGWTSLAVGPDGKFYPTPALVGQEKACGGHLREGLETVWRQSPTFATIRNLSVASDPNEAADPLRHIIGGSDMDHSFTATGRFSGGDPYRPLYGQMALRLLADAASSIPETELPQVRLAMGDRLLSCDNGGKAVSLTHSNCVLSVAQTREVVGSFYADAAETPNADILNPVCYDAGLIDHIPQSAQVRSYGCGSPVMDADLTPGETLVDLGSGAGVECFIAARQTGPEGRVVGVDMTERMLALANGAVEDVAGKLGYANVAFQKGFLEAIPLEMDSADVVISNCVVNLSEDKQRTFREIYRVLKPGGRLVISDVTTDTLPSAAILNDAKLRGECIAGALVQRRLMALLESIGFERIQILKRFFYRQVQGHRFYSLTYRAFKPGETETHPVLYPGPFAAMITDDGQMVLRGEQCDLPVGETEGGAGHLFALDANGEVLGPQGENSCACYLPPEAQGQQPGALDQSEVRHGTGCMQCGRPLEYLPHNRPMACTFCGETFSANAVCGQGHFVCDRCHSQDAGALIRHICLTTAQTDMIALVNTIRSHPVVPLHGPEHHVVVPGAIVATYRNLGGAVSDEDIATAMDRGQGVPGGSCGFWGGCGAALGAGIAFGVMLKSSPVASRPRQMVQQITGRLIEGISGIEAARCCQRETWTVLKTAAALSQEYLPIALRAAGDTRCQQMHLNKECPGKACTWAGPSSRA